MHSTSFNLRNQSIKLHFCLIYSNWNLIFRNFLSNLEHNIIIMSNLVRTNIWLKIWVRFLFAWFYLFFSLRYWKLITKEISYIRTNTYRIKINFRRTITGTTRNNTLYLTRLHNELNRTTADFHCELLPFSATWTFYIWFYHRKRLFYCQVDRVSHPTPVNNWDVLGKLHISVIVKSLLQEQTV